MASSVDRKLLALHSGTLKRPANVGPPVQSRRSRKGLRTSIAFAMAYAGCLIALRLNRHEFETFPDNYCLKKHSNSNWYYVCRQPSLRAARRMVAYGLDDPCRMLSILPDTVRELSNHLSRLFLMMMIVSGEKSFFPKPGITCCGARRYYTGSILEGYSWFLSSNDKVEDIYWNDSNSPLTHGAEVLRRVRVSSRQVKPATKTLKKSNRQ